MGDAFVICLEAPRLKRPSILRFLFKIHCAIRMHTQIVPCMWNIYTSSFMRVCYESLKLCRESGLTSQYTYKSWVCFAKHDMIKHGISLK